MSNITDEIVKESIHDGSRYILFKNFLIVLSVLLAAIFIGETLFGKNSLEVYLSLQQDKRHFAQKIDKIQYENAALQKEYFELNSLMPKEEE
jgi:cell division protein FtsB